MFDMATAIEISTPGPCGWGGFQCNNDSCIDINLVNNISFAIETTAVLQCLVLVSGETTTMFDMAPEIEVSTPGSCGWDGFQCNNDSCICIDMRNKKTVSCSR